MAHRGSIFRSCLIAFGLLSVSASAAAVPLQIPYFGHLTYDSSGSSYSGVVSVTARLYEQPAGGSVVWTGATIPGVVVQSGALSFVLEDGTPALSTVYFDVDELWLELDVNGTTLAPRQRLLSVPYAVEASNAAGLGGVPAAAYLLADDDISVVNLTAQGAGWFDGGVRVGDTPAWSTCDGTLSGAIRYDAVGAQLLLCDGAAWRLLLDETSALPTIPWSSITGIPAGFADGTDDVGPTYTAGFGLQLAAGAISADSAALQRRIGPACPSGEAIVEVAEDGTPTCAPLGGAGGSVWEDLGAGAIRYAGGDVAVGSSAPTVALDVQGTLRVADGGEVCSATIEGAFRWNAGTKAAEVCNGTSWSALGGGGGGGSATGSEGVVIFAHEVPSATNPGTNVANAWTTRTLNVEVADTKSIASLAGNQFTLPPGTYFVESTQTFGAHVDVQMQFRSRIRNVTDGVTVAVSETCRLHMQTGASANAACPLVGVFDVTGGNKTFALQYWSSGSIANVGLGFGSGDTSGEPNRFATVTLRQMIDASPCGQSSALAAASCTVVRQCGETVSNVFWLDTDGLNSGAAPFRAYCDLEYDGGGWALLGSYSSGARMENFNPLQSQHATTSGGTTAPSTWYPTPAETQYGHMSYARFDPAGREVMFTCGTSAANPTQYRYKSASLFSNWSHGDKGTYGTAGSPGWGHLSHSPATTGRGNHWLCGVSAIYNQWGIAYCSGNGTPSGFGNHLASFNNQVGAQAIGCNGASGARMMVWIR